MIASWQIVITSRDNEKLRLIRKLGEGKHRRRERLFVAEGEDLIAAAELAGAPARFVLWAGEDVEPALLNEVSTLGSGTRVIGVYPVLDRSSDGGDRVNLFGVADPANVGAIIRTTHALSRRAVALGAGCADPYSPKAVRASMGSIFAVTVVRGDLGDSPPPIVGLVARGGEPPDDEPVASLCLGGERDGLPGDVIKRCDRLWTIPLVEGGAESLNVAAAAAVALGRISSAAPQEGADG